MSAPARPTRALRVLVADDDPVIREGLRGILHDSGMSVVGEAEDGEQAIELATVLHPDVILMDLRMPFLDGIDAARTVNQLLPGTPIVMLSAYDDDSLQAAAIPQIFCYLVKGCRADLIVEMIARAHEWAEKERALSVP